MSNLQEITDAIDGRLSELRQQIASLEAARRALTGIRRSGPAEPAESTPPATTRKPARARRSRVTAPRRAAASESASASPSAPPTPDPVEPAGATPPAKPARRRRSPAPAAAGTRSEPAAPAAKTPPKARATRSSSRTRRRELEPGQIEGLLRDSEEGLSLVALARRTGVSETKVTDRLRTLERSGEVRSSGPRRTSLWRLVTDEERIAERAAELARASQPKT